MSLDILKSLGAFVSDAQFEKKEVEWRPTEDADPVVYEISVKKESTVADVEFMTVGNDDEEDSFFAKTVHRRVRINSIDGTDVGSFQLPYDEVKRLKPTLLMAFMFAITEVDKVVVAKKGKTSTAKSPRKRNSGVNSRSRSAAQSASLKA